MYKIINNKYKILFLMLNMIQILQKILCLEIIEIIVKSFILYFFILKIHKNYIFFFYIFN